MEGPRAGVRNDSRRAPTRRLVLSLPSVPASAGEARRGLAEALRGHEPPAVVDTAVLLANELVTNAVLHAPGRLELLAFTSGATVRVEVRDGSASLPGVIAASGDALSGRGMALVEMLASRWGAEPFGNGKVVWFEVDR